MQYMHGNIPYLFDYWTNPVVHLLQLNSSIGVKPQDNLPLIKIGKPNESTILVNTKYFKLKQALRQESHLAQTNLLSKMHRFPECEGPEKIISKKSITAIGRSSRFFIGFNEFLNTILPWGAYVAEWYHTQLCPSLGREFEPCR